MSSASVILGWRLPDVGFIDDSDAHFEVAESDPGFVYVGVLLAYVDVHHGHRPVGFGIEDRHLTEALAIAQRHNLTTPPQMWLIA